MTWWLLQHSRLRAEKAAIAELEGSVDWLTTGKWQANNDLEMGVNFAIRHGGKKFGFQMQYPNIYPDTPPMIFTENEEQITNHQYGASGELCLEHRPDNWHPSVTGADMVLSCHRLIAEEQPEGGEIAYARSAHVASLGRDLRSALCRFLMSEKDLEAVSKLPLYQAEVFSLSERKAATSYLASILRIGSATSPIWVSDLVLPEGFAEQTGTVVRIPGTGGCGTITAEDLGSLLENAKLGELRSSLLDTKNPTNLLMGDGDKWELFAVFGEIGDRKVLPYKSVMVPKVQQRLPVSFETLGDKNVGIVGCGSIGSKIAASLCRCGIERFLLIDEDIFFPGNVVRNELDLRFAGAHKAFGLRERLTDLAPKADVKALRISLGGQESATSITGALEALGDCDVLIDATASPIAFNLIAAMATRKKKPMVWAEVFAGGIGGFVVRTRPDLDPTPLLARRQIET
ncbi:MAG: hypothetical protein ACI80I_001183, partial [Akkermansiaceae bacterium]